MPITQIVIDGVPGSNYVASASLVNVVPLECCLDNKSFNIIQGSAPGNKQTRYYPGDGKFLFVDTFGGNMATDTGRAKIYVRYKY